MRPWARMNMIVHRFFDYGGEVTCKQLSEEYGEPPTFYTAGSVALAKKNDNRCASACGIIGIHFADEPTTDPDDENTETV